MGREAEDITLATGTRCPICGSRWHDRAGHFRPAVPAWIRRMQERGLPAKDLTGTA